MKFKEKIKTLLFGYRATSESYIRYLRNKGVIVGDDVTIYRPMNTTIDTQNPHMLSIGSHIIITGPVTILTHDYSWGVLKRKYGDIVGNQQKTEIGDNVFIGWGATILGGSRVGNNVIIGANSVVSGVVESNSVYAGNPAHKIMSLEEFYQKRKSKQLDEAVNVAINYFERYNSWPKEDLFDEYFFLFASAGELSDKFKRKLTLTDNFDKSYAKLQESSPYFPSFEKFLDYCKEVKKRDGI